MVTKTQLIVSFAESIATMEGFYNEKPSVAFRNNNPGNLRSWGTTPIHEGFARFPTLEAGWKALRAQVEKNLFFRKLTIREFFAGKTDESGRRVYGGYAPAADANNPTHCADFVCKRLAKLHPGLIMLRESGPGKGIDTALCQYPYQAEPQK
jgi:hypothetical protein